MYCTWLLISKIFSVIKVGFHNSKVKARSFLFISMAWSHFSQIFTSKETLKRNCAFLKDWKGSIDPLQVWGRLQTRLIHHFNFTRYLKTHKSKALLASQIKIKLRNLLKRLKCCFVDWLNCLLLVNTSYLSIQKISMVVTSFNTVCCSKSQGFHTFYSMMKPT